MKQEKEYVGSKGSESGKPRRHIGLGLALALAPRPRLLEAQRRKYAVSRTPQMAA